jgi:tyrosine-protein kinase Etk/Wzc
MNEQQVSADQEVDEEISLLDILQVIVENLRLLVIGPILVGLIALGVAFVIRPTFTATTTFLPPQQQQSAAAAMLQTLGALGGAAGGGAGLRNPADQYVGLASSRSVRDALIERFDLLSRYELNGKESVRKQLQENTRFTVGRDGLIRLEVDDHDPKVAAEIANAYLEELSRLMGRLALTEAQQRRALFEGQLKKAKEGLTKADIALKASGINESAIKASPSTALANVAALMAQITAKEVQISAMRNYLTENAPDFVKTQAEISALRAQLMRAEKSTSSDSVNSDYVSTYRDYKYYETLFELMAKQYEIARIDESREATAIQIVDIAVAPEYKAKPKKLWISMIAALVSFILILVFIFTRQAFRKVKLDPNSAKKIACLRTGLRRAAGGFKV